MNITKSQVMLLHMHVPGDALHIFWVRGRAIGRGIDFPDNGIRSGIDFHNFGIRNRTNFQDFGMKYKVWHSFSKNWYTFGYTSSNIGLRNGYDFEDSMARPRP